MAEQSVLPAPVTSHEHTAVLDDHPAAHPGTSNATPQDELYKPLPPGCWTVPFHGNCPRCHHHHRAAQVHVKITEDPDEVSHVRCEKCREKWAAFGGLNTTRISLLSTATTEPDSLNNQARYSLIQIVEMAVEKARLEPLAESVSPALSRQSSGAASTRTRARSPGPSTAPAAAVSCERDVVEGTQQQDESLEPSSMTSEQHAKLPEQRHRTVQLLSRLKSKVTTQLSRLRKAHLKLKILYQQPAAYTRQCPPRTPPISTMNVDPLADPTATLHTRIVHSDDIPDATESIHDDASKPTRRFADVVTFIASLDKGRLDSMDDQERVEWMRENYADFKNRNEKSLRYTSATDTSPSPGQFDRRSYEVRYAGTHIEENHIEGLGDLRDSLAISEAAAEQFSNLDGSTVVSIPPSSVATLTQESRPEAVTQPTVADRSSIQSRRRSRRSQDMSLHSRVTSFGSLRGHAGTRLSQGSMIVSPSMTNIPETASQSQGRRSSSPESIVTRPTSS